MSTDNELYELIKSVSDQAKYLLAEVGEFFPVASILEKDSSARVLAFKGKDEHPKVDKYLQQLSIVLSNYDSYAIAINVKVNSLDSKMDAIQIKLVYRGVEYQDYFIPYTYENSRIKYYDLTSDLR